MGGLPKSGFQKLEISYNIYLAYGAGQVTEKEYPIFWHLLDASFVQSQEKNQ